MFHYVILASIIEPTTPVIEIRPDLTTMDPEETTIDHQCKCKNTVDRLNISVAIPNYFNY